MILTKNKYLITTINNAISVATNSNFHTITATPTYGGDINQTFKLKSNDQQFFLKLQSGAPFNWFQQEFNGLLAIRATQTIDAPKPIVVSEFEDYQFLVLEYLQLTDTGDWHQYGEQLANLHKAQSNQQYGWVEDNYIGHTIQKNSRRDNWAEFFAFQRIGYQLELASCKGYTLAIPNQHIINSVHHHLVEHQPTVSLVHGDLWKGNMGFTIKEPVLFDPACYYGDREVDLAMTELFGQLPEQFYRGYHTVYPIDNSYQQRKPIYNLYHLLNHLNLFGRCYLCPINNICTLISS
ncbi:fructosamine kinase family protein [Spartinivicinus ruber]|uniref:fructosamine kinase family protein n=1 Tax=Spartinivicinus ruber TaxID=2683272 RepID=UPI0013D49F0A|nr:fructosamine kinase family protein [Spartinivicinus ruber]